jgi:hypothetical protein
MRRVLALLLAVACLAVAACADREQHSGDSRFGGFYGGISP